LQKLNKIKISKKLNEIELEKENMLAKLNYACAACDKLKSENTVLVEKNKSLENKLKDSNDHLGFDKFGVSTSLASNSERITLFVKLVNFENSRLM